MRMTEHFITFRVQPSRLACGINQGHFTSKVNGSICMDQVAGYSHLSEVEVEKSAAVKKQMLSDSFNSYNASMMAVAI